MSGWDVLRARQRGDRGRELPRCSRCQRVRVLDPCRDCATAGEAAHYPDPPADELELVRVVHVTGGQL